VFLLEGITQSSCETLLGFGLVWFGLVWFGLVRLRPKEERRGVVAFDASVTRVTLPSIDRSIVVVIVQRKNPAHISV
jgi:hypothetical protein